MSKLLTTCSKEDYHKCKMLEKSLKKYGWDFHIILHEWKGFGDKIIVTCEYLKTHPEITHFFYTDAWDSLVFDTMESTLNKIKDKDIILLSAEKNCYPHPSKAILYPETKSPFKYVNGGGWFCNSSIFCAMVDKYPLTSIDVDQVWLTDLYLNEPEIVRLDTECEVFQTIAFCAEDEFNLDSFSGKAWIRNKGTDTFPTFFHGNGHTPMNKLNELI